MYRREDSTELYTGVFGPDTHMQGHVRMCTMKTYYRAHMCAPRHMTTVLGVAMLLCQRAAAHLIWCDWQLVCYMY